MRHHISKYLIDFSIEYIKAFSLKQNNWSWPQVAELATKNSVKSKSSLKPDICVYGKVFYTRLWKWLPASFPEPRLCSPCYPRLLSRAWKHGTGLTMELACLDDEKNSSGRSEPSMREITPKRQITPSLYMLMSRSRCHLQSAFFVQCAINTLLGKSGSNFIVSQHIEPINILPELFLWPNHLQSNPITVSATT